LLYFTTLTLLSGGGARFSSRWRPEVVRLMGLRLWDDGVGERRLRRNDQPRWIDGARRESLRRGHRGCEIDGVEVVG